VGPSIVVVLPNLCFLEADMTQIIRRNSVGDFGSSPLSPEQKRGKLPVDADKGSANPRVRDPKQPVPNQKAKP